MPLEVVTCIAMHTQVNAIVNKVLVELSAIDAWTIIMDFRQMAAEVCI